jgi:hypothetical protein
MLLSGLLLGLRKGHFVIGLHIKKLCVHSSFLDPSQMPAFLSFLSEQDLPTITNHKVSCEVMQYPKPGDLFRLS